MLFMEYYTGIIKTNSGIELRGYRRKNGQDPELLQNKAVSENESIQNVKAGMSFPQRLIIPVNTDEMIFKNILVPVKDAKTIASAMPYEFKKHFRIAADDFHFSFNIWGETEEGTWITIYGIKKELTFWAHDFCKSGFIPELEAEGFRIGDNGTVFIRIMNSGKNMESVRLYHNGCLIGWNLCDKKESKLVQGRVKDYAKKLGLDEPREIRHGLSAKFHPKTLFTLDDLFPEWSRKKRNRFMKTLTITVASLAAVIYLTSAAIGLAAGFSELHDVEEKVRQASASYNPEDLKKSVSIPEERNIPVTILIHDLKRRISREKAVKGLEYRGNEVVLTVQTKNVVDANAIVDDLKKNSVYMNYKILDGAVSNESRIYFKIQVGGKVQ